MEARAILEPYEFPNNLVGILISLFAFHRGNMGWKRYLILFEGYEVLVDLIVGSEYHPC